MQKDYSVHKDTMMEATANRAKWKEETEGMAGTPEPPAAPMLSTAKLEQERSEAILHHYEARCKELISWLAQNKDSEAHHTQLAKYQQLNNTFTTATS